MIAPLIADSRYLRRKRGRRERGWGGGGGMYIAIPLLNRGSPEYGRTFTVHSTILRIYSSMITHIFFAISSYPWLLSILRGSGHIARINPPSLSGRLVLSRGHPGLPSSDAFDFSHAVSPAAPQRAGFHRTLAHSQPQAFRDERRTHTKNLHLYLFFDIWDVFRGSPVAKCLV